MISTRLLLSSVALLCYHLTLTTRLSLTGKDPEEEETLIRYNLQVVFVEQAPT